MKPKHQRLLFVSFSLVFLCVSALLSLRAFRENLVFYYSPSDLLTQSIAPDRLVRIGGLVAEGSLTLGEEQMVDFTISDGAQSIGVTYYGLLPNLFREGQGVVAEGYLSQDRHLQAKTILAKHDETYMPREVVESLKRSGRWKGSDFNP